MAEFPPHVWIDFGEAVALIRDLMGCGVGVACIEMNAARRDQRVVVQKFDGMNMVKRQSVLDWLNDVGRHSVFNRRPGASPTTGGRATIQRGGLSLPLKTEKPTVDPVALRRGREQCGDWLKELMQSGPQTKPKNAYFTEAKSLFGISPWGFDVEWSGALKFKCDKSWGKPGRRKAS